MRCTPRRAWAPTRTTLGAVSWQPNGTPPSPARTCSAFGLPHRLRPNSRSCAARTVAVLPITLGPERGRLPFPVPVTCAHDCRLFALCRVCTIGIRPNAKRRLRARYPPAAPVTRCYAAWPASTEAADIDPVPAGRVLGADRQLARVSMPSPGSRPSCTRNSCSSHGRPPSGSPGMEGTV